ncbi:hypothetical protein BIW11_02922 [Tropilaelaps mercedesae]|uniref:Uncharacterized protein n=1 Tax=Tropilaelaps mercedesae TaxID=418985 RepID=A0A1V9XV42_9ACAR|nr:hypothetical protein BIW11_02922 [Tropilaelaps mercedesae]
METAWTPTDPVQIAYLHPHLGGNPAQLVSVSAQNRPFIVEDNITTRCPAITVQHRMEPTRAIPVL